MTTSRNTDPEFVSGAVFRIEGVVQGVGYRWWTKHRADQLSIRGSVRNLPDQSVEVVAWGDPAALRAFHVLLEEGPPASTVTRVQESEVPVGAIKPRTFEIES